MNIVFAAGCEWRINEFRICTGDDIEEGDIERKSPIPVVAGDITAGCVAGKRKFSHEVAGRGARRKYEKRFVFRPEKTARSPLKIFLGLPFEFLSVSESKLILFSVRFR
jgi:hypothetical protein